MVILEESPNTLKSRMKSYLKRVVYRPVKKKDDKKPRKRNNCGYLGDDERAELDKIKRTFSPPPRNRPYPLVISHQSEETLHHINDIGSAASSHSSGFNESLFEILDTRSNPQFESNSPNSLSDSECNFPFDDTEFNHFKRSTSSVFEGFGGVDSSMKETGDLKEQRELINSLTHRNKILTEERKELQKQLENQEDLLDQMDKDINRLRKERSVIVKQKKDEVGRMKLEGKELEHTILLLREQRIDTETKLQLMEKERDAIKEQLDEAKSQLLQAIEEHNRQKDKNNELIKQMENKEKQLCNLEDEYKQDSHESMATQYRLEELLEQNLEMKSLIEQLKTDKEDLSGRLTKATCELSRLRQGVPLSPTASLSASITSPISSNFNALPEIVADDSGEALCDVLAIDIQKPKTEILDDTTGIADLSLKIDALIEDKSQLQDKNAMLQQELEDMKKLMYVVAPQHYIDDPALHYNNGTYTKPMEMRYECFGTHNIEYVVTPVQSSASDREECMSSHELSEARSLAHIPDNIDSPPTTSAFSYNRFQDDADSGVLSQSSTEREDAIQCDNCCLLIPENRMLLNKVASAELECQRIKDHCQMHHMQSRSGSWMVHIAAFLIVLLFLVSCLPLLSERNNPHYVSWTEYMFSVHHPVRFNRKYRVPH